MGICSSCLGRNRRGGANDEDDGSRLLYEDMNGNQYGTFGDHDQDIIPADSQEVQRETEALQKVVAQTSNHLVDIFAMVPQAQGICRAPAAIYTGQDSRLQQYQAMLAGQGEIEDGTTSQTAAYDDGDWPSESEDDKEEDSFAVVKPGKVGPLLGGFADLERQSQ